jgi:hypothetical protein
MSFADTEERRAHTSSSLAKVSWSARAVWFRDGSEPVGESAMTTRIDARTVIQLCASICRER